MMDAKIGADVYIENAIIPPEMHVPDGIIIRADSAKDEVILVTNELLSSL